MDETLRRWTIGYTLGQSIEDLWGPRGIVLPYLFGRDHLIGHETLVLTEGEFDAMLPVAGGAATIERHQFPHGRTICE